MNQKIRNGNGKNEKNIRDIEEEGLLRFNDHLSPKSEVKKKKWVKHNSQDLRIGNRENLLGELLKEREGEDYIAFSWLALKINCKSKIIYWI